MCECSRWIQGEFQLPSDGTKDIQKAANPLMGEEPELTEPKAMAETFGSLDVDLSEGIAASMFVTTPTLEVGESPIICAISFSLSPDMSSQKPPESCHSLSLWGCITPNYARRRIL